MFNIPFYGIRFFDIKIVDCTQGVLMKGVLHHFISIIKILGVGGKTDETEMTTLLVPLFSD